MTGQNGRRPFRQRDEFVARVEPVVRIEARLVVAREARLDRFGQLAPN